MGQPVLQQQVDELQSYIRPGHILLPSDLLWDKWYHRLEELKCQQQLMRVQQNLSDKFLRAEIGYRQGRESE
jgi:hypothetical protein